MPYLNLDPNYHDHPKTMRLIARLGEMADALPIRLWSYCARVHPKDGYLKGYSEAEVEGVIKWRGTAGMALESLIAVGFIRKTENGFVCVDWKQHQGHLEAFSRRGRENAKKRWASYATSIPMALQNNESGNAPAVPSLPTIPDHPTKQKFSAPTIEEVKAYCLERSNSIDAQKWHDYYTSNGWMVGKNRMKDWRAAVRTWEKSNGNKQGFGSGAKRPQGLEAPTPGKYAGLGT